MDLLDLAGVMNSCDAKANRLGLTALTDIERVVSLVSRANFEIELGGIGQFYDSAGNHAIETVNALDAVGAAKAASALRKANEMFPNGPPAHPEQRYDIIQQFGESDPFSHLTREFYAEKPDVWSRLCTFIEEHAADLVEHQQGK